MTQAAHAIYGVMYTECKEKKSLHVNSNFFPQLMRFSRILGKNHLNSQKQRRHWTNMLAAQYSGKQTFRDSIFRNVSVAKDKVLTDSIPPGSHLNPTFSMTAIVGYDKFALLRW